MELSRQTQSENLAIKKEIVFHAMKFNHETSRKDIVSPICHQDFAVSNLAQDDEMDCKIPATNDDRATTAATTTTAIRTDTARLGQQSIGGANKLPSAKTATASAQSFSSKNSLETSTEIFPCTVKKSSRPRRERAGTKSGCKWDARAGIWVPLEKMSISNGATTQNETENIHDTCQLHKKRTMHPQEISHRESKRSRKGEYNKVTRNAQFSPAEEAAAASYSVWHIDAMARRGDLWSTNETVLAEAMDWLSHICYYETMGSTAARQFVLRTGMHMLIIRILDHFTESIVLQRKGLKFLFDLAFSPLTLIEKAMIDMGAVEAAVAAMGNFPQDTCIKVYGCSLLSVLLSSLESWELSDQYKHVHEVVSSQAAPLAELGEDAPEGTVTEETMESTNNHEAETVQMEMERGMHVKIVLRYLDRHRNLIFADQDSASTVTVPISAPFLDLDSLCSAIERSAQASVNEENPDCVPVSDQLSRAEDADSESDGLISLSSSLKILPSKYRNRIHNDRAAKESSKPIIDGQGAVQKKSSSFRVLKDAPVLSRERNNGNSNERSSHNSRVKTSIGKPSNRREKLMKNNKLFRKPTSAEIETCQTNRSREALKAWYKRYNELILYRENHGDCQVPQKYEPNPALGIWVNKMRQEKKLYDVGKKTLLTSHKVKALEAIDFAWGKLKGDVLWEEKFKDLIRFQMKYGHCNVPTKFRIDSALGRWVSTQRRHYKEMKAGLRSTMTADRAKRLEMIGFRWNGIDSAGDSGDDNTSQDTGPMKTDD